MILCVNDLDYSVRSAVEADAKELSRIRVQIDGETENMDRERGEGVIDEKGFRQLILADTENPRNLFLVAVVNGSLVGFSRCESSPFKRASHRAEFGVCILKDYWGHQIGKNLVEISVHWADTNGIKRMVLYVLETNTSAIGLYQSMGFEIEGILRKDKLLSDGNYYDTILMGRTYMES